MLMSLGDNMYEGPEKSTPQDGFLSANLQVVEKSWLQAKLTELDHARAEHERFRNKIRQHLIESMESDGMPLEAIDQALEQMELEPIGRDYRVIVRVWAYQDVEVEVRAASPEEARQKAMEPDDDEQDQVWRDLEPNAWTEDILIGADREVKDVIDLGR